MCFGDTHRSVLSPTAARLVECDALLVRADDHVPDPNEPRTVAYNIVRGLPDAIRRLRRDGPRILIVHGTVAERDTLAPPGLHDAYPECPTEVLSRFVRCAAGWGVWWDQHAAAGTLRSAQCQTIGQRIWCAATVTLTSLCHRTKPLLSHTSPPALVHFDTKELAAYPHFGNWRYFTTFPCTAKSLAVCVAFKTGRDSTDILGMRSKDGLHFKQPFVVLTARPGQANMAHNLAVSPHADGFLLAGGLGNIWLARGTRWRSSTSRNASLAKQESPAARAWSPPRLIINGSHPGCVEKRVEPWLVVRAGKDAGRQCEYDGRLALVSWPERGRLLLFARANPALKGQRFVQVSSSKDNGSSWSPFELIKLRGYDHQAGNLYFFAAQVNPIRSDTLVAFFPLEHTFSACICMATSRDGIMWSVIQPVLPCSAAGERPTDHPMFGLAKIGKQIHLCTPPVRRTCALAATPSQRPSPLRCTDVHESVPDILHEMVLTDGFYSKFPYLRSPASRIVRYNFSAALLRQWTHQSLQSIAKSEGVLGQMESLAESYLPAPVPASGSATCRMPQLSPLPERWNAYTRWLYDSGDNGSHLLPTSTEVKVAHVRLFSDTALRAIVLNPLRCSDLWACGTQAFSAKVNVHVPEHFAWALGSFGSGRGHSPAQSNAWVEVTHCAGSKFERNEQPWFYIAPGSGMFVSVGRTMAFATHEEGARRFLGKSCKTFECDEELPNMTAVAARLFDSLQFTRHCDGTCGLCQHELVMLRAGRRRSVASPCHEALEYRRGVGAALPCTCTAASVSSYGRGTCAACAETLASKRAMFPWEAPPTIPGSGPLHSRAFVGQSG